MSYSLGVDLGTASCAAACRRGPDVEPCVLGEVATTMPAVVLPRRDGSMLVGEMADRRCRYEPPLVARTIAGRLADPDPTIIDDHTVDPVALAEALLGTIVQRAAGSGEWPRHLVLTFPLRLSGDAEAVLEQAAARITTSPAMLVPEPIAAMAKLAHDAEIALDTVVAVVDFGGSSFDVTLVRRTETGFDLVGEPASLPDFGGTDIDAAVLAHAQSVVGDVTSHVREDDLGAMMALRQLRASCRAAKEQLSTSDEALVDVMLPELQTQVPISRHDLERAIEDRVAAGVDLITSSLAAAELTTADVQVALLVGGSARLPLLARLVTDRTGLPIASDLAPELTVSLGAAMFGEEEAADAEPPIPFSLDELPAAAAPFAGGLVGAGLALAGPVGADDPWTGGDEAWDPVGPPSEPSPAAADWQSEPSPAAADWQSGPSPAVADWQSEPSPAVADWQSEPSPAVADWQSGPSPAVADWQSEPSPAVADWQSEPSPAVADWQSGPSPAVADWQSEPSPAVADWQSEPSPAVADWQSEPSPAVADWQPQVESWAHQPWDAQPGTSVFDGIPPVLPGPPYRDAAEDDDSFRRLTASDSDPFGTRSATLGVWLARQREAEAAAAAAAADTGDDGNGDPGDEHWEDDRKGGFAGSTDPRVVIGGIAAGLIVVLLGGFALAAGTGGGSDDNIAVGQNNFITTTTELPTSGDETGTTTGRSSTSIAEDPTTTGEQTTDTTSRQRRRSTGTSDPGTPPATSPPGTTPHTSPPTTNKPPSTTTTSTSTTTTSTTTTSTTTTTTEPPPPGP